MEPSTRALALVVAVLLVVPATAGTADPATGDSSSVTTPPVPTDNTTARLVLEDSRVQQSQFRTVRLGVATSIQSGTATTRITHERLSVRREFAAADSTAERRRVVDQALIDLETRSDALIARERNVTRAYGAGSISTATFVRRLAVIDTRARGMLETLATLRRLTFRIGTSDFDARIRAIEGTVKPLRGPVRRNVALALSGERPPARVSVAAADQGVVLSMLVDGQYVREATDWQHRDVDAQRRLQTTLEARNRAGELYPWVVSQRGGTSVDWHGDNTWRWGARHPQGQLVSFIDAGTRDVFREVQRLQVAAMPATSELVRVDNGIRLVVRRTYVGGPLTLYVEDAATDAVVNARVTVGGHELGAIGADGVVTTLEPRSTYAINVTSGGAWMNTTVDPDE